MHRVASLPEFRQHRHDAVQQSLAVRVLLRRKRSADLQDILNGAALQRGPACDLKVAPAISAGGFTVAFGNVQRNRLRSAQKLVLGVALAVLRTPAGRAPDDVRRMSGLDIAPSTLHREARRQGERALRLREADVELTDTLEGIRELSARARAPERPFTLVIEIDAWHIRDRDHWGETEALRKQGDEPSETLTRKQRETLDGEIGYFERHKDRMDYKNGKALDQPLGSGAMESTCAQYQCRFKRTGQFWSLDGDEAFLALQTLHWNNRWHWLFPHDIKKE